MQTVVSQHIEGNASVMQAVISHTRETVLPIMQMTLVHVLGITVYNRSTSSWRHS